MAKKSRAMLEAETSYRWHLEARIRNHEQKAERLRQQLKEHNAKSFP